jgi:hypothetical protein
MAWCIDRIEKRWIEGDYKSIVAERKAQLDQRMAGDS